MRPKLHADTFYLPVADGVYIRNNRSHLTIRGKTTYRWLESLSPYFNGQHDLEELTNDLDVSRKTMVIDLVELLFNHHFLSDLSLDQPHTLSKEELATYTSEIAFIESFQPSAAQRFETFRRMSLLVIGNGVAFSACIRSCLYSGIMHLSMVRTTEEPIPDVSSTVDDFRFFLPRDASQHIQELSPPQWNDRSMILNTIQPFDAILHISDRPMLARTRLLNALCVEQQKLFLQACFVDNRAWVGPLVKPGIEGCWECAWLRLQSNIQKYEQMPFYALEDQYTASPGRRFAFPVAALAANQLVFELFKSVTQAGPLESVGQMISSDLETLSCRSYSFLPHLHCQSCQHPPVPTQAVFLEQIQQLEEWKPLDKMTFSKQAALCFDDQLGLFRSIDEGNFEQLPLAVCKVEISNVLALQGQLSVQSVVAVGTDFQEARLRSTQRACEIYAAGAVDPRCLVTRIPSPDLVIPLERFLTMVPLATPEAWSWALHLHTGQPCLVPASLVFSSLMKEEPTEVANHGIGSGMSWSEALCQALLDWACYLTVTQRNDRQHPFTKIDLQAIEWRPEGKHLCALLTSVSALPDIYDITGGLGVPTFAICIKEQAIAYISHCDALQALSSGLELALQRFQSHHAQQLEYDTNPVPPLSPSLQSDQYAALQDSSVSQEWSARLEWIQRRFQKNGWYTVAVPLNHDRVLAKVLPFLVRVLLVRIEGER